MIKKDEVIAFFDRLAPEWDKEESKNDNIIEIILDNAGIKEGSDMLDVACGTGIMIPYYLRHGVRSVLGVDISPEMIRLASSKCQNPMVEFMTGDAGEIPYPKMFHHIMIYNAYPHFASPENLLRHLMDYLEAGGTVSIAHGMSRRKVNACHEGSARHVSRVLPSMEEMSKELSSFCDIIRVIDDERMVQIVGRKKNQV